mmetsp:Transcript_98230/g.305854  ORF Transcript_98230/g.305854 Transcript_98230/m.305854 type:complete len:205 (-) Transcript_98230:93-707(-)
MHLAALLAGVGPLLGNLSKLQLPKDQQLRGPVLDVIGERLGSANFLVFGTGLDSPLWKRANQNGRTYFLENHREWVEGQPGDVQAATVLVSYSSRVDTATRDMHDEALLGQFLETLPAEVRRVEWDQILVDGPEGWRRGNPGRGQSIYAASRLAGPKTVVFIDDCNRRLEREYTNFWLLRRGRRLTMYDNGHSGKTCRIGPEEI